MSCLISLILSSFISSILFKQESNLCFIHAVCLGPRLNSFMCLENIGTSSPELVLFVWTGGKLWTAAVEACATCLWGIEGHFSIAIFAAKAFCHFSATLLLVSSFSFVASFFPFKRFL